MANLDGRGPQGKGPMTGRGMGNCILPIGQVPKVTAVPRAGTRVGPGFGSGGGMGRGPGMGRGRQR